MPKKDLHLYTVMPLDVDHVEEICSDVKKQYEEGVATCALFSMTLVPEGSPTVDKARLLCDRYLLFRDRLASMGIPNGVLVQASIGHGWVLSDLFPYQQYVQLTDGQAIYSVCPADEGFREYIRNALATVASCAPGHIMIDDDLRLMFRPGGGCACPLHMKRMETLSGERMDREKLLGALRAKDARGAQLSEWFVQTQRDSLIECAKIMREAIDSVDPTIPGSFCSVSSSVEFGVEIANVMAGKGNPSVLRIHNSNYSSVGAKFFSKSFLQCAASIAKIGDGVEVILAETDTCPQNRYSTGARSLHTHFTGSILEGAVGAKHWITRMISYEPESGKAYRRILGTHRNFYQALSELVPSLRWHGFRVPVSSTPAYPLGEAWVQSRDGLDAWSCCVLERMGLPLYFSATDGGVVCMEGNADEAFSDEEILEMLKGKVMLASDTAERLIERGFERYLGVRVLRWTGKTPTQEMLSVNGNRCSLQVGLRELRPLSDSVRALSTVVHSVDKIHFEDLFPGSTAFENELGGTVFVFCGTPKTEFDIKEAYSFLNYSRKLQLTDILEQSGELPLYYPGDEDVYFRTADMKDGGTFCALFNLSSDPIENPVLVSKKKISKIERLCPDGTYANVNFKVGEHGAYSLELVCEHLDPVILVLYDGESNICNVNAQKCN